MESAALHADSLFTLPSIPGLNGNALTSFVEGYVLPRRKVKTRQGNTSWLSSSELSARGEARKY